MRLKGSDLIFIAQIDRDGAKTSPVSEDYLEFLQKEEFEVNSLSISYGTHIASGFNSFVVKIKPEALEPHVTLQDYKKVAYRLVEFWDKKAEGDVKVQVECLRTLLTRRDK